MKLEKTSQKNQIGMKKKSNHHWRNIFHDQFFLVDEPLNGKKYWMKIHKYGYYGNILYQKFRRSETQYFTYRKPFQNHHSREMF